MPSVIIIPLATFFLNKVLNVFQIPMVGATITSEILSDKSKYDYFLRIVPSDFYQGRAIIDILLHFNWTYISAINSPGSYGESGKYYPNLPFM